jgi:hypothetical protein
MSISVSSRPLVIPTAPISLVLTISRVTVTTPMAPKAHGIVKGIVCKVHMALETVPDSPFMALRASDACSGFGRE